MKYWGRGYIKFLILIIFILSGFFIFSQPVSAIYATTTNPIYLGYNFRDVSGIFVANERFWFDGEHYRFSFTPTRDFYTAWWHYGDRIAKGYYYDAYLNTSYFFQRGGGGGSGTYFVENINDLSGYESGDGIFFLWEQGKNYDTYIIEGDIPPSGLTQDNMFLNWHFKIYPDDRLKPEYSKIKFMVRYGDNINYSYNFNYIDYDYTPEPDKLDPVIIIPGILGSWNFGLGWELDPILETYDNLWLALENAGYERGKTLFAFPYDWNNSNADTAIELKNKIDQVIEICDCTKVDLVAHSMGGLVARSYIEGYNYQNDVDQLIFLATPHRGSPKAYLMWEGGEFGQKRDDFLMERVFSLIADSSGYNSIFDLIKNNPIYSIKELLPLYDYLKRKDSGDVWQLTDYDNNYPQNEFLEELNSDDNLAKLDNIDITNIIASSGDSSTINYIRVVSKQFDIDIWEDGYPDNYYSFFGDHGLEYGYGDDTVPYNSNVNFYNFDNIIISSSHKQIVTDAQREVIKELTGSEPVEEIRKNIFSKYLMIRIFSPADFVVISPSGQKVGKDFINNNIVSEIEGAFYSGFNSGPEFVLIPDPVEGEYKVELQGTGDGEYKLSASLISDDLAIDSDYNGLISLNNIDDYKIILFSDKISDLNPDIKTIEKLMAEIDLMYQKGWLNHFGSKNALLSLLKNDFQNNDEFEQLNNFLDNMLEKNRINQRAYDIIKLSLLNIKNNL